MVNLIVYFKCRFFGVFCKPFLFCCHHFSITFHPHRFYSVLSNPSNTWEMSLRWLSVCAEMTPMFSLCLTSLVSSLYSFPSSTFYCGHLQKITTITVTVTNLWSVCFKSHLYQLLSLPQAAFGCNSHSKVDLLPTRSLFMCSLFALIWNQPPEVCWQEVFVSHILGQDINYTGFLKQMLRLHKLSSPFYNPLNFQ